MALFFVGVIKMSIVTLWTKLVVETRVVASGVVTMINILIWYYVLQKIVDDISNWQLVLLYAFGCAVGTVISTYYFHIDERSQGRLTQDNL